VLSLLSHLTPFKFSFAFSSLTIIVFIFTLMTLSAQLPLEFTFYRAALINSNYSFFF